MFSAAWCPWLRLVREGGAGTAVAPADTKSLVNAPGASPRIAGRSAALPLLSSFLVPVCHQTACIFLALGTSPAVCVRVSKPKPTAEFRGELQLPLQHLEGFFFLFFIFPPGAAVLVPSRSLEEQGSAGSGAATRTLLLKLRADVLGRSLVRAGSVAAKPKARLE